MVIKADSTGGVIEWSWICGGGYTDIPYDVVQDESGFYYVAGSTNSVGAGGGDFIVMKFSPDGTTCATSFNYAADGFSADDQALEGFTYRKAEITVTPIRHDPAVPVIFNDHELTGRITTRSGENTRQAVEPTLTVICY